MLRALGEHVLLRAVESSSPCSWPWSRVPGQGLGTRPTLNQGCTAPCEGQCSEAHPLRQIVLCDTGAIAAGILQCNEPMPWCRKIGSDLHGQERNDFPSHQPGTREGSCAPPDHLQLPYSRLHSSTQRSGCSGRGASVAMLVMMASAAECKLLEGAFSVSKENDPRPERSCQGHAGIGGWEEGEAAATFCCAAAPSGAEWVMKRFTRLRCLVIPG